MLCVQISHDEDNLTRLRQGMEDRSVQLEALRTAYHREVIQVLRIFLLRVLALKSRVVSAV